MQCMSRNSEPVTSTVTPLLLIQTDRWGFALQALSESMYDLAHIGAQRVAKLCREPSGLACWALELLEEQACMVGTPRCSPGSPCM